MKKSLSEETSGPGAAGFRAMNIMVTQVKKREEPEDEKVTDVTHMIKPYPSNNNCSYLGGATQLNWDQFVMNGNQFSSCGFSYSKCTGTQTPDT